MDAQLVGALLELTLKRALGRPDEKLLEAITASGVSDRRVGGCALGVGERDAVVLVEIEAALARAIDIDDEGIQRLRVRVLARGLLRNDRSFANEDRRLVHRVVSGERDAALAALAGEEIDPAARRKIDGLIAARVEHGSDQHFPAEEVFA